MYEKYFRSTIISRFLLNYQTVRDKNIDVRKYENTKIFLKSSSEIFLIKSSTSYSIIHLLN